MELLAPAGNIKALKAAVAGGADAVYLGAGDFNARSKADNFGKDELRLAVSYCHERGVRVYFTLNTLVKDRELERAAESAEEAAAAGIDAFIVQDMALAAVLSERFPKIPLHASTQSGIHNKWGAMFAKRAGFDRIIFSRETLSEDMRAAKDATGLETECFVHGAHCVSFSGNCYFSAIISGYSGNRGKCMQLCRKKYTLSVGGRSKTGYMLSAKDICLLGKLGSLEKTGIDSLKIEGRLRSPEYAYTVTKAYKDALLGKTPDTDDVRTVFNRGEYSCGYICSDTPDIIYPKTQSNIGSAAGSIAAVKGKTIALSGKRIAADGDGYKILRGGRETGSASCINGRLIASGNIRTGDEVRLTRSSLISARTNKAISECDKTTQSIKMDNLVRKNTRTISDIVYNFYDLPESCVILRTDEKRRFSDCGADTIILAPSSYDIAAMKRFADGAKQPVLLELPVEARGADCELLEKVRDENIFAGYVANNVYALEMFADKKIIFGSELNILSDAFGAPRIVSCEAAAAGSAEIIPVYMREIFMNLTHCPAKQLGYSCGNCAYDGMTLRDESGAVMPLRRRKLHYCYYELLNSRVRNISHKLNPSVHRRILVDIRNTDINKALLALKNPYALPFDEKLETCGRWGKGVK